MAPTYRALLPALLTTVFLAACGGGEAPGALPEPDGPVDVRVSPAVTAAGVRTFPATLTAQREARVATRLAGRIEAIPVDVGDAVAAGDLLLRLDDSDVRARVEAAEAQAELAERTFRRIENLAADGAASEQELDEARARLEGARGQLREATAQLGYVEVRAPFDGLVASRSAEPGDLATPGRPLLTVVGRRTLEVEADLPSELTGRVRAGDEVRVWIPGLDARRAATVRRVAPALAPGSRRLRVEAVFSEALPAGEGALPGSYARIELPAADEAAGAGRWIPRDAVIERGQLTGVFAVEADTLRLRWLRLGRDRGDVVEVLAGPSGPLEVVREPGPTLRDGQPVGRVERVEPTAPEEELSAAVGSAGMSHNPQEGA